jgi:hypothetical protein
MSSCFSDFYSFFKNEIGMAEENHSRKNGTDRMSDAAKTIGPANLLSFF